MNDFFKEITVIEVASVLAGPSVGMFFAELGAKVIKIENQKSGGDVTRTWKLASEDPNHPFSAYYSSVNYGKESLFLDLTSSAARQKMQSLLRQASLLIVNFKAGDAQKLGLSFEEVKGINPKLIYAEISGFGEQNRLAYDLVLQAESGMVSMNGTSEKERCKLPVAFIDLFAAHQLKEGILLAMLRQQKEKKALKVSVSLYESALAALVNQATNWLMGKEIPKPMGMLHPNIAPYGESFRCKDGKTMVLAIGSDRQFQTLCQLLKLEDLAHSQAFGKNQNRLKNRLELEKLLAQAIRRDDSTKLMSDFIREGVPAGIIRSMDEVFEQKSAQKLLLTEEKEGKTLRCVRGNVFQIST